MPQTRILLPALALLLVTSVAAQQPVTFAERQTTTVGVYSIESDPADAAHVRELTARLQKPDPFGDAPPGTLPFGLEQLKNERAQVLQEMAALLSLPTPTAALQTAFDRHLANKLAALNALIRSGPSRFTLWRKDDLVARLRAGQRIPGFTLDADGSASANLNLGFKATLEQTEQEVTDNIRRSWAELVWPVKVTADGAAKDVDDSISGIPHMRRLGRASEATFVFSVLHESIEEAIADSYLRSADRRWFAVGASGQLALEIITQRVGEPNTRLYFDPAARAGKSKVTDADLKTWPPRDSPAAARISTEDSNALYARAIMLMRVAASRHGPNLMPRLFKEIGKTPVDQANIATVRAAYQKLTGEPIL
jgi:hypothetical protein